MGLVVILFSLAWVGIGRFMKKYPDLISGYNTMSPEKKMNVDIQAVGDLFCRGFQFMATATVVIYFGLRLAGLSMQTAMAGFLAVIFLGTPVLLVMARKHDKNPRSGLRYYLTAGIMLSLILAATALCLFT